MSDDTEPIEPGPDAAERFTTSQWVVTEPLDPQAVEELREWIDADSPMIETLLTRGEVSEHGMCVFGSPVRLSTESAPELLCVLAVADARGAHAPVVDSPKGDRPIELWAGQALWARPEVLVTTGETGVLVVAYASY